MNQHDESTQQRTGRGSGQRRERWALGRFDYLILRIALAVVVVSALVFLAPQVIDWAAGRPLQVESVTSASSPTVPGIATRDGATAAYGQQIAWSLPHASAVLWLLNLVPKVLTSAVVIAGALLLWRLVGAVQSGRPFGADDLRTIRILGVMVLLWSVSIPTLQVAATTFTVFEARVDPEVEFMFVPWSLAPIVVGLLLLVLAELFRVGSRLQDDVEGLV